MGFFYLKYITLETSRSWNHTEIMEQLSSLNIYHTTTVISIFFRNELLKTWLNKIIFFMISFFFTFIIFFQTITFEHSTVWQTCGTIFLFFFFFCSVPMLKIQNVRERILVSAIASILSYVSCDQFAGSFGISWKVNCNDQMCLEPIWLLSYNSCLMDVWLYRETSKISSSIFFPITIVI